MTFYKHPVIPKLLISNLDLEKNVASFQRLKDIYDRKIPYIPDDFPMLINNTERLYKGICKALQEFYPDKIPFTKAEYNRGHHFVTYIQKINQIIPVTSDDPTYQKLLRYMKNTQNRYNNTRFEKCASITDFDILFRRYEHQTARLFTGINLLHEKVKGEELDIDIEKW